MLTIGLVSETSSSEKSDAFETVEASLFMTFPSTTLPINSSNSLSFTTINSICLGK